MTKKIHSILFLLTIIAMSIVAQTLDEAFQTPPHEARPIIIWQWMDGVVTKEGIRADLEAYTQAGLGGVQQFHVGGPFQGIIRDTANAIGTKQWQELMRYAIKECHRLGLSFGTHNCPGWSSSAYPTVTPEYSMQQLVWRDTVVTVSKKSKRIIPSRPYVDPRWNYYEEIAIIAMPADSVVKYQDVIDITDPTTTMPHQGSWRILRFGHTTNGKTNEATAPYGGVGLECDKMSREAVRRYWSSYPQMLIDIAKEASDHSLSLTSNHRNTFQRIEIDSYEAGGQSWTREMPSEFMRRRGYDLKKWLPVMAGLTIESKERTKQFKADFAKTGIELFTENYYGYMAELAHQNGLRLLYQPYGTNSSKPFNPINTDAIASRLPDDLFCTEFWTKPNNWGWPSLPRHMQTAHRLRLQHIYAEGFTHWPLDAWQESPETQKILADRALCLGVNHLMLHAGAQNPWPQALPGMTFGKWGSWWTPGQTWWRSGGAKLLFQYLARYQALLQRGEWVDDYKSTKPTLTTDAGQFQWTHRKDGEADIFFISNPSDTAITATINIDRNHLLPELWMPETGEQRIASHWQQENGKTLIRFPLEEHQSLFIILRKHTEGQGTGLTLHAKNTIATIHLNGQWTLQFPEGWDAPANIKLDSLMPWNEHTHPGIRYFSGTATYSKTFRLKHIDKNAHYILDLGRVKNLAQVTLNGFPVSHLWKSPFHCDISPYIKKGDNFLQIAVTNLWPNRMIGDEQYPDDIEWDDDFTYDYAQGKPTVGRFMKRIPEWLQTGSPRPEQRRKTVVSFKFFHKDSPLLPSGLLGPATIRLEK